MFHLFIIKFTSFFNINNMTTDELKKLRDNLPKNGREILAEKFGCSIGHINNVLTGQKQNKDILIAAAKMASEHLRELEEATRFVQSLPDTVQECTP